MRGELAVKVFVVTKRNLWMVCLLLALTVVGLFGIARGISVAVATEKKRLPIYSVKTDLKQVAITFDAAWGADDTHQIINVLEEYNAKATFFVLGDWVDRFPESILAFHNAGHTIANHSDSHADMTKLDRTGMLREIEACNNKIEGLTGKRPTLFRAPSGAYNNQTVEVVEELGMYCIQWDVDSLDYKGISAAEITDRVLSKVQNGSILLFHNDVENTPFALADILKQLVDRGYTFVTVNELIYSDNYTIDHAGRQKSLAP